MDSDQNGWDESASGTFIDYGRYFIPERERQIQIMVALIPPLESHFTVFELCCGEGLLAEALLEHYPNCTVIGFDGSEEMLGHARDRLAHFGERFQARRFDMGDHSWRFPDTPVQGVVSSLAIHHLDRPGKQKLFRDVYNMLALGGVFTIADVVAPAHPSGWTLAADQLDEAVRQRALDINGNLDGFHAFERLHWNTFRHFDPEDIDKPARLVDQLKWLGEVGFVDVDLYWMSAGHAVFGGWKSHIT